MEDTPQVTPKQTLSVPLAIIVAGALIAGAVLVNNGSFGKAKVAQNQANAAQADEGVLAPVTSADHILGNPDAPVMLVEYSDFSCPFCKMFNPTMEQVMDTYGKSGKVAWVYRHFPLDKPDELGRVLHVNAGHEAQAVECAADQGGNEKFWAFEKMLYKITPSVTSQTPEGLDQSQLSVIAKNIGLDVAKFDTCLASNKYKQKVDASYTDGINAGVLGTPFTFIVTKSGKKIPINGAQSFSNVKAAIDTVLANETNDNTTN